jgi:hypothetical protein
MRAAFFKGRHKGWRGLFGVTIWHWTRSDYSHCELQFSDGMCASALWSEGGVRYKFMELDPAEWDFIDLPNAMEPAAKLWFDQHVGKSYDFLGDLHFVIGTVAASRDKWFCSRAVADALGIEDGWRYYPGILYSTLKFKTQPLPSGFFTPIA